MFLTYKIYNNYILISLCELYKLIVRVLCCNAYINIVKDKDNKTVYIKRSSHNDSMI